jgi:predicted RNA-binding Zn ribbon-like protein
MTDTLRMTPVDPPGPGLDAAVDFVNTTGLTGGRPFDDLATIHDALHWLVEHALLSAEDATAEQRRLADPADAKAALDRLRSVRHGLRELVDATEQERAPVAVALEAVNEALTARESAALVLGDDGRLRLERRREGTPIDRALAEVTRRVATEFDEGRPERFRVCGNDRCRWVFYDRSRPGSRRWCEMSSCGNRMKAARHRARQKASVPEA